MTTFKDDETHLPITMQQFEDLTNEITGAANVLAAPHFLDSKYVAQVLMSAIHAMPHTKGLVKKSELLESVINRVSCHLTYDAVQDIQAKLKLAAQATETPDPAIPEAKVTNLTAVEH